MLTLGAPTLHLMDTVTGVVAGHVNTCLKLFIDECANKHNELMTTPVCPNICGYREVAVAASFSSTSFIAAGNEVSFTVE